MFGGFFQRFGMFLDVLRLLVKCIVYLSTWTDHRTFQVFRPFGGNFDFLSDYSDVFGRFWMFLTSHLILVASQGYRTQVLGTALTKQNETTKMKIDKLINSKKTFKK